MIIFHPKDCRAFCCNITFWFQDVGNLSELDESAILGDDDVQEERSVKDEAVVHHEETEELDYDEDLEAEKAPRSSKFSSERVCLRLLKNFCKNVFIWLKSWNPELVWMIVNCL